jgi:uncharacterized protein (DUF58 family)
MMADALSAPGSGAMVSSLQQGRIAARMLADRLPRLVLEARRIAATSLAGLHGRRRAGPGESFWQFRPFAQGEAAQRIDWRRSARDDQLYVREREWEAAHTVWIWIDASPSMHFRSPAALAGKFDHAAIIGLALADLLVRGGERVGLWGMGPPVSGGNVIDRLAMQWLGQAGSIDAELPESAALPRHQELVLISDFLSPPDDWLPRLKGWGRQGGRGHLLRIIDPVEAAFPFRGQGELIGTEQSLRLDIGDAEAFRALYQERMHSHQHALKNLCKSQHWSWLDHHSDQPVAAALLALVGRVSHTPSGASSAEGL